jgi:hypothetical protein
MATSEIAAVGTVQNFANIFASPGEAFRALRLRPTFLLPLAAVLIAACAVIVWYYARVDLVWLIERSLDAAQSQVPADARQQLLDRVGKTSPYAAGVSAAGVSAIVVLLLMALAAGYLAIVSMLTNDGYRFKNWFALVCWSSLPLLLSSLATMVNLAVSDVSHLPAEQLNPLSIVNLLGLHGNASGGIGARLLQSADVTSLWALGLTIFGYSLWTKKGIASSALIVAGPLLVIAVLAAVAAL